MLDNRSYQFDDFLVDAARRLLLRGGQPVPLTPKAFDTLLLLIEQSGQVVQKDELMSRLWPDTFVEEGSLTRNIYLLRKALGDNTSEHRYIITVPGKGYRFVADVKAGPVESAELRVTERLRTTIVVSEEEDGMLSESSDDLRLGVGRLALPAPKPRRRSLALAVLLVTAGVVFGIYRIADRERTETDPAPPPKMTISDLTTTGNVTGAAISPDGNYVAYAVADKPDVSSLHLLQLETSANQAIIPPSETSYEAVTFSPDGKYVYYITLDRRSGSRTLYRVPPLGGPSKKIVEAIGISISFSPDASQLVFRRAMDERRESALFLAEADGTGEREIVAISYPDGFGDLAWSPDGKRIVCVAGHAQGGSSKYLVEVSVGDWTIKPLSYKTWRGLGQLGWLADSSGFVAVAAEGPADPFQVWQFAYPGGQARRITNDPNFYNRLSVSADSRAMVVLRRRLVSNVWLVPGDDPARAKQITFGTGGYRGRVSWTPDARLVYDSYTGSAATISVMNSDGGSPRQLTGDMTGRAYLSYATVSADGRHILFVSDVTGVRHIWRMDIDGNNQVQLTDGSGEDHPDISPDGKWVVYTRMERGELDRPTLWKISIDGGEPRLLTDEFTAHPAVSPDGKLVAALYAADLNSRYKLGVYPIEGGKAVKTFQTVVQGTPYVRWTADGRGLTYADSSPGASSIWVQPLDGGAPRRVVEFDTERLFGFDWSRDGKALACVRGFWAMDAVLIRDFIRETE